MITTKALVPFQKKVSVLAKQVEGLEIVDTKTMSNAVVMLSTINQYSDKVKAQKEKLTKPINESLKNVRAMFKPLETTYEGAIEMLRAKMSSYQTQEVARVREEEAKIAERTKAGKGNLSIDTAVRKIEAIETPEKEVATDEGLVQFVEVKKFEVIDMKLLPIEYHVADDMAIRKAMKEGKELAGVKYWTEQQPRNYR